VGRHKQWYRMMGGGREAQEACRKVVGVWEASETIERGGRRQEAEAVLRNGARRWGSIGSGTTRWEVLRRGLGSGRVT